MCACTYTGQKRILDPLELELQVIVSCHTCAEPGSSGRVDSVLLIIEPSLQHVRIIFHI